MQANPDRNSQKSAELKTLFAIGCYNRSHQLLFRAEAGCVPCY